MKCPACGVNIEQNTDCTACGKWNGAGREPQKEPFPFNLQLHEAIRKRAYSDIAATCYAGITLEGYEERDGKGRTAEEYAMELGDLKALQMIRKGKKRHIAHDRQNAFFHGILEKIGLESAADYGDEAKRRKYIVVITLSVLAAVLMFVYRPLGIGIAIAGIMLGMFAGIKAMVHMSGAKAWFGMAGFMFLVMFASVVMSDMEQRQENADRSATVTPAAEAVPPQKRPDDPKVPAAVAETRALMAEGRFQEAQALLITLLTDHPDSPAVKQLAKDLKSHPGNPAKE